MDLIPKTGKDYYLRAANAIAVLYMLLYGIIRCLGFALESDYFMAMSVGVLTLFHVSLLLVIAAKTKDKSKLAFRMPAVMLVWFVLSVALAGGTPHFFIVLIGLSCFSGMYFSYKNYMRFLLVVNIAFLLLAGAARFRVMGPDVAVSDVMVSWFVSLIGLSFPTLLTKVSTNRHMESVKAQDFFHTVLAYTPDLVMLLNDRNRVVYVSDVLTRYSNIAHTELAIGRPVLDLFPDLEMKLLISEMLDMHGLNEVTREVNIGGETLFLKIIVDEVSGDTHGLFLDICDVTTIMRAKVAAEQGVRAKSEFLARMSHEIRTPMNAITGMTELVLREDLSPAAAEHAREIKQASANLLSIINDILDYSKIESGHMEILPINYRFSSLISDVVSIIRMRVREKPVLFVVNVDCNIPNQLVGDEVRIRQVLLNVLSNAVKFTSEGHISLAVTGEITEPDCLLLTIEISDSGRGIKNEDLDKLFKDFMQLPMPNRLSEQGTGLGLSITRSLLRQMGGDISVFSTFGVGSTFTILLPQKFTAREKYAEVENAAQKSVLVYEPRSIYADSIICTVDNLGVRCSLALTQSEFSEKLSAHEYPYVFVSSFLLEKARDIIDRLGVNTKLVLLAEFGTVSPPGEYTTLSMPVHSISVANFLNGVEDELSYSASAENNVTRFIAPDARVLIVDDIGTNLHVASGLMAPYRMQVDSCLSGVEAIDLVKANEYDIVFMDHMMPGMDGVEATERIRGLSGERFKTLPIIALTANAVSGMREMFLQNGFSDYLPKPVETLKLHSLLEQWIDKSKQQPFVSAPASGGQTKPSFSIKGVDVRLGLSFTGGSMESYLKTLTVFYHEGLEKHSQLLACLEKGDVSLFTIYVHALRSSSASIGASRVSMLAEKLEQAGMRHDINYIDQHSEAFLAELKQLLDNIAPSISSNTLPAEIDTNTLHLELVHLKTALEAFDLIGMDEASSRLAGFRVDIEVREMLDQILSNVYLGKYESALHTINSLL